MQDMASPMSAFVRDRCDITDPGAKILRVDLYREYKAWCDENGHKASAISTFGRDLRAVVPELTDTRVRSGDKQHWCYGHIRIAA
jgi:putative DNA primase/helicase